MGRPKWVKNPVPKRIRSAEEALCNQSAGMALCRVPPRHIAPDGSIKIENFDQENFASDLHANGLPPGFFTHFGGLTVENYESVFLTCRATKCCFSPACDQNLGSVLLRCDHGSNFRNFDLETSYLYANGPDSFSPGFFTDFGRPTAKNYESVFLTVVRRSEHQDQAGRFIGCTSRRIAFPVAASGSVRSPRLRRYFI